MLYHIRSDKGDPYAVISLSGEITSAFKGQRGFKHTWYEGMSYKRVLLLASKATMNELMLS